MTRSSSAGSGRRDRPDRADRQVASARSTTTAATSGRSSRRAARRAETARRRRSRRAPRSPSAACERRRRRRRSPQARHRPGRGAATTSAGGPSVSPVEVRLGHAASSYDHGLAAKLRARVGAAAVPAPHPTGLCRGRAYATVRFQGDGPRAVAGTRDHHERQGMRHAVPHHRRRGVHWLPPRRRAPGAGAPRPRARRSVYRLDRQRPPAQGRAALRLHDRDVRERVGRRRARRRGRHRLPPGGGGRCGAHRRQPRAHDRDQRALHRGRARAGRQEAQAGVPRLDERGLRQVDPASVSRGRRPRHGSLDDRTLVLRLLQGDRRVPRAGLLEGAQAAVRRGAAVQHGRPTPDRALRDGRAEVRRAGAGRPGR